VARNAFAFFWRELFQVHRSPFIETERKPLRNAQSSCDNRTRLIVCAGAPIAYRSYSMTEGTTSHGTCASSSPMPRGRPRTLGSASSCMRQRCRELEDGSLAYTRALCIHSPYP
jgi:hypothetical protein